MERRTEQLLRLIIDDYIKTAEPVGSKFLVEQYGLDVSGATVRNEMRELEEEGYLTHPHTSAGRLPTESGYRYYVNQLMEPQVPKKKVRDDLQEIAANTREVAQAMKDISKYAAEFTENAVIIAFNRDSVYYTGISYLFAKPEFHDYLQTATVSAIFDHCEEYLPDLFNRVEDVKPQVLVGLDNPLGRACSLVLARLNRRSLFGILGPMRMEYGRNVGLVQFISEIF